MKNTVFALVDCNNFYASCERLFRPELRNQPIVVLSNNDGCIVARSNEAKALGIQMGSPYFKNKPFIKKHRVQVFSSNYCLYGDLSHRVMAVLQELEPEVEIYSIDEAFISLPAHSDQTEPARHIKAQVEQHVGIPVSIGIASTKTLAKIANRVAKKNNTHRGVFSLLPSNVDTILAEVEVHDVWGIGSRSTEKLHRIGIYNALQLKNANDTWIRTHLTITGLRTVLELRGTSCIALETAQPHKQSIVSSRSFAQPITTLTHLQEAISHHAAVATKKLRQDHLAASAIHIYIFTNRYRTQDPQYSGNTMVTLPTASSYTPTMLTAAMQGLTSIFKQGYRYNKAGVMLTGLMANTAIPRNLFLPRNHENPQMMAAIDHINSKLGRGTIQFAGEGLHKSWAMKQSHKSPAYTTKWHEIPVVHCPTA